MFTLKSQEPLFIFDLANNHNSSLEHGLRIIKEVHEVTKTFPFKFGFKLQYRHIETLIHPDYKNRMDLKYIKRFTETRLDDYQMNVLKTVMQELGFITVCTPFDEYSVELAVKQGFDILKIASCSFTDWALLEAIVKTDKSIIASTAGATMDEIGKVVSFFEHRNKDFAILHCVAEYPTANNHLQLDKITTLKNKFPQVRIGFSTHEYPFNVDAIKVAIGKGATIFEKHTGIKTETQKLNDYSANPEQISQWLQSAYLTYNMCKITPLENERKELQALRRGMFANKDIKEGYYITSSDVFLAMPNENQYTANDMSKYVEFRANANILQNEPIKASNTTKTDSREKVYAFVKQVRDLVVKSGTVVPQKIDVELSHHYGIDRFPEYGMTIFTVVNREYCKKLLILLPNQFHPEQWHELKDETFNVLYGDVNITLDGIMNRYLVGDVITVAKGVKHSFGTKFGCIIEEISSTHYKDDSYYTDPIIMQNKNRKTQLTYWME